MASFSASFLSHPVHHIPNPKPRFPLSLCLNRNVKFSTIVSAKFEDQNPSLRSPEWIESLKLPPDSFQKLVVSTVLFVGLSIGVCSAAASNRIPNVANLQTVVEEQKIQVTDDMKTSRTIENFEDEKSKAAFEKWKSTTYALTVPLRIVALRGSVPPSWIKDFTQSQGWRASLRSEIRGSLDEILSDLSTSFSKGNINPKSAVAADIVTVGDSWLNFAIKKGVIEPLQEIEDQDWFQGLSDKWKEREVASKKPYPVGWGWKWHTTKSCEISFLKNSEGNLDPEGKIWAAPYRWGSMVIAYKKSKFQKHNLAPIEDWADLWRPELAGKISMVDSPREVVGAVLKCMGASYNTTDIDAQVAGGRNALQLKLLQLKRQVRLFDSVHYLNALKGGDVWVAVGWSSDILPAAKRMSNISVIVPKSGASLWADLWAIPAASRLATSSIGGRVRGPSPLVHQWIEFCLQPARALPFLQEVIPGASPFALGSPPIVDSKELAKKKPKLDTNLVVGVPPAEILAHCEFLEPLSDAALADYQWLIAGMQEPPHLGLIQRMQHYILSVIQTVLPKTQSKVT